MGSIESSVNKIRISYLVASYNHQKFIQKCLDSILTDGEKDIEILILDDGSTDNSRELIGDWIQSYKNTAAKLMIQENRGISATLNTLVKNAQGRFLRVVASDDMLMPNSSNQLIELLEKSPDKLVAVGDVRTVDISGNVLFTSHMQSLGVDMSVYEKDIQRAIIADWAICGPAGVFRKNFQELVGKYDENLVVEDWSMYLRLAAADKVAFLPQQVAYYRLHGGNSSRTKDVEKRILNLTSQRMAGQKGAAFFTRAYRILVKSRVALLDAKLSYLRKRYLRCASSLVQFISLGLVAKFIIFYKKGNYIKDS